LTSFQLDASVFIDGGSVGVALTPEEMKSVRHVVVTHAHSDHTASLPLLVAESYTDLDSPITVYGLAEVLASLRAHIFNGEIWPDFSRIPLPGGNQPALLFQELEPEVPRAIAGYRVTAVPVNHTVPAAGLVIESDTTALVYTSDTYSTDDIWRVAAKNGKLKAVFADVSFPNEMEWLAVASKHLTPALFAIELKKLARPVEAFAVHIKRSSYDEVARQLAALSHPAVQPVEIGRWYEF